MTCQRILICGAGPAGLTASIELARVGHDVTLLDYADFEVDRVGEHVSARAAQLLCQLGINLAAQPFATPCNEIRSAWGGDQVHGSHALFHPEGLGFLVSRPDFDRRLAEVARHAGVQLRLQTRVVDLHREAEAWRLTTRSQGVDGRMLADLVIDATGRGASIATKLGVTSTVIDQLIGVCGFVDPPLADPYAVLVETMPDGWWYSAGLPDGTSVATYLTDTVTMCSHLDAATIWSDRLKASQHTRLRFAGALPTPRRVSVRPAHSRYLQAVAGSGWLAVGDSALSYDPLSSAGIEKSLAHARLAVSAASGGSRGAAAYQGQLDDEWQTYLDSRRRYYAREQRWATEPFWQRRIED